MSEDNRKQRTKKALENAMVSLLQTKSFDDITTSQLAKEAHISRSSFYTHYKDKYDMIESYQQTILANIEYIFDRHHDNKAETILEIFYYLNREDLFAALLSQNGTREIKAFMRHKLQNLLSKDLPESFQQVNPNPLEPFYAPTYFSHAIFGVCQTWIARGKKESPEEITQLLIQLLGI